MEEARKGMGAQAMTESTVLGQSMVLGRTTGTSTETTRVLGPGEGHHGRRCSGARAALCTVARQAPGVLEGLEEADRGGVPSAVMSAVRSSCS
jgi:hypothetical protein